MKQRALTNWDAIKIGLLLSTGVALLLLIIYPASGYFAFFVSISMIIVFPFGITGALLGKLITKTRTGAWLGAAIMIFFWCWWISATASKLPLD